MSLVINDSTYMYSTLMNNVFNKDTYLNTSIWVAPNWVASCWDVIQYFYVPLEHFKEKIEKIQVN